MKTDLKEFKVQFTEIVERKVTTYIIAASKEEAIEASIKRDYDGSNEELGDDWEVESKNFQAIEL